MIFVGRVTIQTVGFNIIDTMVLPTEIWHSIMTLNTQ
jgi:hypothetical protein